MIAVLRVSLACLPALAIAGAGILLDRPLALAGALAALPIVVVASLLVGRGGDTRSALTGTLSALAVRLVGAAAAAVLFMAVYAAEAPAAIAVLGLALVGGLMIDTWAVWRDASAVREPLHA